jgi:uncharacterized protein (TIGR00255 family)
MLLSMTGFVSKTVPFTINGETVSITISIKTLNSRFFEVNCKMPHVLGHCEHMLHKKLKEKLSRGSVQCSLYVSSLTPFTSSITPSLRTIEAYLQAAKTIQKEFGKKYNLTDELSIKDIITLPSVFEQAEEPLDTKTTEQLAGIIDNLIEYVVIERQREGAALQKDLEGRLKILKSSIKSLEERSKNVLLERREKLLKDTMELLKDTTDEAREHHMQQLHSQLERMEIHEEIVRFKTHIKNMELCIKDKSTEKGKKIDFILQELLRETNTIASKCLDAELSGYTITIKVELEKSREQAQNIV